MLQSLWVNQVQEELRGISALGTETTQEVAELLVRLSAPMLRSALVDAVSQLVQEAHDLGVGDLRLTISGDELRLEPVGVTDTAEPPSSDRNARIALRLPQELKESVERTASQVGVSTNTWIVNALHASVSQSTLPPRVGNRLRGSGRA